MNFDMKNNIKSNIKKENKVLISDTNTKDTNKNTEQEIGIKNFKIGKKKEDKISKKSFPLYVDGAVQKKLDSICKKTNYSRNELINMMIKHCLDNLEFED